MSLSHGLCGPLSRASDNLSRCWRTVNGTDKMHRINDQNFTATCNNKGPNEGAF